MELGSGGSVFIRIQPIHGGALSGSNESGKSRPEVWTRESLDFAIVRVTEW